MGVANGDVFFTETPPVAILRSHDMDGWKAGEGGPTGLNFIREYLQTEIARQKTSSAPKLAQYKKERCSS